MDVRTSYRRIVALPSEGFSMFLLVRKKESSLNLCDDSSVFSRFKTPLHYLETRKQTENG